MADAPDPDRVSTPPSDPPSSEDAKKAKTKHRLETAKSFAIPSSVIGALITAVTAYVNANDTSLEKKTYETVVAMVEADRKDISTQNARLATIEQALIQSALSGRSPTAQPSVAPLQPSVAPPPEGTPGQPAPRPRQGRVSGGARDPVGTQAVTVLVRPEDAFADYQNAKAVANTLGRKITRKDVDGDGVQEAIVVEAAPEAPQEAAPAPDWNEIAE